MYRGVCSTYPAITGFLTQHTLKVIDYQIYRLCQSFGTLTKFMMQKQFLDFSDSLCSNSLIARAARTFGKV